MSGGWVLPEQVLRDAPTYTPRPHELADLELLLSDAYTPLSGFLGRADLASIARTGRLADGTSWPVPVALEVPQSLLEQLDIGNPLHRVLVLTDPEGAPMAAVDVVEVWPVREGISGVAGRVRRIGDGGHAPFKRLRRTPAEVRALIPPMRRQCFSTSRHPTLSSKPCVCSSSSASTLIASFVMRRGGAFRNSRKS